jgi:hypothetical protein
VKRIIPFLLAAFAFGACEKSHVADDDDHAPKAERAAAATFREGKGVLLSDEMRTTLGLRVAEVTEQKLEPAFVVPLRSVVGSDNLQKVANPASPTLLSGLLGATQAAVLKPGAPVELRIADNPPRRERALVRSLEGSPLAATSVEMIVETDAIIPPGVRVEGVIHGEATAEVPTVPRSALLRTVQGTFVYVENAGFFLRTPVKIGAMNDEFIEIIDGLYAGDDVAISAVTPLWMTELQTIRGGKACCAPSD